MYSVLNHLRVCCSHVFRNTPNHALFLRGLHTPSAPCVLLPPNRSILRISGRDSFKFLQGLVTKDLRVLQQSASGADEQSPAAASVAYTAFLNSKGRVKYDAIIYRPCGDGSEGDDYLLECDSRIYGDLVTHLRMYKLRSKVLIQKEDSLSVYTYVTDLFGAGLGERDGDLDLTRVEKMVGGLEQVTGCGIDPRVPDGGMGVRFLAAGRGDLIAESIGEYIGGNVSSNVQITNGSGNLYEDLLARVGVSEGKDMVFEDLDFPLQVNFDIMHGVDFDKGCYLGQELTARTRL